MRITQVTTTVAKEHMFSTHIFCIKVDHTNNTMYYIPIRTMSAQDIEKSQKDVNTFFAEIDWKGEYDYEKTESSGVTVSKHTLGPWECPGQLSLNKDGEVDLPR